MQLLIFKHSLPGQDLKILVGQVEEFDYSYQISNGSDVITLNRDEYVHVTSLPLEVNSTDGLLTEITQMRQEIQQLKTALKDASSSMVEKAEFLQALEKIQKAPKQPAPKKPTTAKKNPSLTE